MCRARAVCARFATNWSEDMNKTLVAAFTLAAAVAGGLFGYKLKEANHDMTSMNCQQYQTENAVQLRGLYRNDDGLIRGCIAGMGVNITIDVAGSAQPEAGMAARDIAQIAD